MKVVLTVLEGQPVPEVAPSIVMLSPWKVVNNPEVQREKERGTVRGGRKEKKKEKRRGEKKRKKKRKERKGKVSM